MTVLASKNSRDSLGINCIERGIVFAMLLLRYSVKNLPNTPESPNVYKDSVKSTFTVRRVNDSQIAFIDSEVRLPYAPLVSLRNAWAVARNLLPITNDDPNPFETTSPPYNNSLAPHAPIPNDPAWVTTLERYFGWLSCLLAANTFPDLSYCQIQILEDAPAYPTFLVKLSLPFRYQNYLLSGNLIDSLIAVVRDLDAEPDTEPIDLSIPSLVSARQLLFAGPNGARITLTPDFPGNSLIATYPNGNSIQLGAENSGALSGTQIVALLSALTGDNRLDAGAIRNIPSLTGTQIATLLEGLTGTDRLNASAIEGLPTGGATLTGTQIVALLSALTGDNRLDSSAIKNIQSDGTVSTGRELLSNSRIYYVRQNGNDNNNGLANTDAEAFASIQKAIDIVASLDIGIYDVTITIVGNLSILSPTNNPIILKDPVSSGGRVTITGNSLTANNTLLTCNFTTGENPCFIKTTGSKLYTIQNLHINVIQNNNYCVTVSIENQSSLFLNNVKLTMLGNNGSGIMVSVATNSLLTLHNMTISGTPERAFVAAGSSSIVYLDSSSLTVDNFTVLGFGHLYLDNSFSRFVNTTLLGFNTLTSYGLNYSVLVRVSTSHSVLNGSSNYVIQ